jgi:hypothetical protein
MMNIENLQNIVVFMKRASVTGEEALGWVQTYQAVCAEIEALKKVPATPIPQAAFFRRDCGLPAA